MSEKPIEDVFISHEGDIQQAAEALRSIIRGLRDQPLIPKMDANAMHVPFRACKKFTLKLKKIDDLLDEARLAVLERQFNAYWSHKVRRSYDLSSYEKKKEIAQEMNTDLRHYHVMIRHPDTGSPCLLFAVGSPDGKGRYVLADRLTKKRTHTSSRLLELLPLGLVKEPPRRENFVKSDDDLDDA
jgi:hypothetical protein